MRAPDLELLWWEGCPSTERALTELREALSDVGLDQADVRTREIETDDQASQAGFRGSPTILVDGVDIAGASPTTTSGSAAVSIAAATAASARPRTPKICATRYGEPPEARRSH